MTKQILLIVPLYTKKLALTSPTSGGRSVGIIRSRTKATELSRVIVIIIIIRSDSITLIVLYLHSYFTTLSSVV
jgi:hypothetical protein